MMMMMMMIMAFYGGNMNRENYHVDMITNPVHKRRNPFFTTFYLLLLLIVSHFLIPSGFDGKTGDNEFKLFSPCEYAHVSLSDFLQQLTHQLEKKGRK